MDIDCDGGQSDRGDERCSCLSGGPCDTQSETRRKSKVEKASLGVINDLNANVHPYVVFGNEGDYSPIFGPRKYGVKPSSVIAVVCGISWYVLCVLTSRLIHQKKVDAEITFKSIVSRVIQMAMMVFRSLVKPVFPLPRRASKKVL